MTITSSTNYYTDFLESKKLQDFLFDFELSVLKEKVNEVFDRYYETNDSCYAELDEAHDALDDKWIETLENKLENNESMLDNKLKLIDEIFCLHIFKRHVETDIPNKTIIELSGLILSEVDNLDEAQKEENYVGLRKRLLAWRKKTSGLSYVTSPSIDDDSMTKLDRCIAKAKQLAENTLELYKYPEQTVNEVYFLYKERSFHGIRFPSTTPVAVLKGCKKTDALYELRQSTPMMEVIAYESAKILGLEDLFTPTTLTSIQSMEVDYDGCIQPFIKGDRLDDVMANESIIPYLSMIDGLIAGLIMGMSDAHRENIFIDVNGEVKFFDNSRTLPHSNKVIKRSGDFLLPTFRNSLIVDEGVFECFDLEARVLINKRIAAAKKSVPALRNYLKKMYKSSNLPEHWLNPKLVIDALSERLAAMEEGMKTSTNLADLIFSVNPYYKFYVSLYIAYQYYKYEADLFIYKPTRESYPCSELMKQLFSTVCDKRHHSFGTMIEKCHRFQINPKEIWKICKEGAWWGDWLLDLLDYVDTVLGLPDDAYKEGSVEESQLNSDVKAMLQFLELSSEKDFKDPESKE